MFPSTVTDWPHDLELPSSVGWVLHAGAFTGHGIKILDPLVISEVIPLVRVNVQSTGGTGREKIKKPFCTEIHVLLFIVLSHY